MRFLEEHELPEWERERRKPIVETIEYLRAEIDKHFAAAAPIIERMVRSGEYDRERAYRQRMYQETELIRRQITELTYELPPFLLCRKDEILERVPVGLNQQLKQEGK